MVLSRIEGSHSVRGPLLFPVDERSAPSAAPSPRVAFFTDCFHEVNGVALTSRQLDAFARRRGYPFFSAHMGPETREWSEGPHTTFEIRRSTWLMRLDADMFFDFKALGFLPRLRDSLKQFRPDLIHITGPGDLGILGFTLARQLGIPLVASWHTDLHKYAAKRLPFFRELLSGPAERGSLWSLQRFYSFARVTLAPNPDLVTMLEGACQKPCFLMRRGIDTELFHPGHRDRTDSTLRLGYVGRLSTEKGIHLLAPLEQAIRAAGITDYRFVITGQGAEREWLSQNLQQVEFTGVLKGEALARAYANLDLFLFPSRTDTFGNVVQEALASGVPAAVFAEGGPKFLVEPDVSGVLADTDNDFILQVVRLLEDRARLARLQEFLRSVTIDRSWDSVFEQVWAAYRAALTPVPNAPTPPNAG